MSDDGAAVALLGVLLSVATFFGLGYAMGSTFSGGDYLRQGRNEGIIYCIEKKQECITNITISN